LSVWSKKPVLVIEKKRKRLGQRGIPGMKLKWNAETVQENERDRAQKRVYKAPEFAKRKVLGDCGCKGWKN